MSITLGTQMTAVGEQRTRARRRRAAAMGDGKAYVELAKIYRDRRGGRRAAEVQLTRALKLDRDHISNDAREEAEALYSEATGL